MSGAVREQFEAAASDEQQRGRIRARWIRWTACDESGNLLFGEGDIDALAAMDSDIIIPVFEAALRINGLGSGAVEEAEKTDGPACPGVLFPVGGTAGPHGAGTAEHG